MADHLSPERRSWNMARIRNKDTKPEIILRSHLHRMGFRFRKNVTGLPGSPDIVLPRFKTVFFVNGCFWHRHSGCAKTTTPATNTDYWLPKFVGTVKRDRKANEMLRKDGWSVIVVWECQLQGATDMVAGKIARHLSKKTPLNMIRKRD